MEDPTRPAPAWLAAQPKAPGEIVVEQNTEPTLQLLLIGKSRKYAIIDGQIVKHGGSYNGSRLVAIKPGGVVLQSEEGAKILKMHPTIEKTIITNKPGQKTGQQVSRQKTVVIGESK